MKCPACGQENRNAARFCDACGGALARPCIQCGAELRPRARFCDSCGHATDTEPAPNPAVAPVDSSPGHPAEPTSFCAGRYEVKRFLGEGGKKLVYLAHDSKLDRDVAFALIKTDGLDEEGKLRITREAQAMGKLGDHPHIVAVYDIGEEAGQPYLVSQLMGGGDVEGLIEQAENHRVPLNVALRVADQVGQALEHAHGHGIVHRDLKPGNVWLTADGTAKLGDFGLALALDRTRLTQTGMMVGTVSYMPPEQATGGDVSARSDLYSLGAMLYELVTGRPPFVGDEAVAIIGQHLNTAPVAPSWHVPDLPAGLEVLILRLLEKDPGKRPATASEVRTMLAGVRPHPRPLPEGEGTGSLPEGEGAGQVASPSGRGRPEGPGEGASPNPLYRRTFVGREPELHQLKDVFDGALSGQGALVTVVGEPGIGKTALCEQLATYAVVRGGKALVGHCYEEGSFSLPYLAFVEALRTYVLARSPEELKKDLGSGAADVARIVSEVRERAQVEPAPPGGDPDEERWRLFQAVAGFLRNASTVQPLVIVLEDLHWADRGTLELLVHLARNLQGTRLLVIGTYRDVDVDRSHPLSAALAELRRGSAFQRLLLRGLTADEVQRMLGEITGQAVSWGFAEAVHRQTEGNPLFVQEVVRYLAEEGLIQQEGGRWQRTGSTPLEMSIPEGLRDVIGRRLSRLSAECNRILNLAAVIGRDFDLATLQAVSGLEEEPLVDALDEAVRVGVLEERPRVGGVRYRFAHAFFRQTLYEEIGVARRLRLHQQVGRALEQRYATRLAEHAAELADHFAHSSDSADLAKAVQYGELAARRAVEVHAYGEAARLLEQALDVQEVLDPDSPEAQARRCDLLLALGTALGPAGEPRRVADEVAEEAFRLAEALGDSERAGQACELGVEALHRALGGVVARSPALHEWSQRLDRVALPGTTRRVRADLHVVQQHLIGWHWREAWPLLDRAIAAAVELDDPETLFEVFSPVIPSYLSPARWADGLQLTRHVIDRPRAGVSRHAIASCLMGAAAVLLANGERERAEGLWRELDELGAHSQDAELLLVPFFVKGRRALLDGDLDGTLGVAEALIARAEELGSPALGYHWAGFITFRALIYLGRAEEAGAARLESRRRGGVVESPRSMGASEAILRLAYLGRADEARAEMHGYLGDLALVAGDADRPVRALAAMLETAILLGEREAIALLAPLLDGVPGSPYFMTGVARLVGGAYALLGDRQAARASYDRALAWATTLRFRPEIALTRLELAELLLSPLPLGEGEGEGVPQQQQAEAQAHLDFAIEEFRAMKMQPSLERALRHKGLLHA